MTVMRVEAALPGTIFHRSSPETEPFKAPGDPVVARETIALIEVMKSYIAIEAEVTGTFIAYVTADGDSVEAGAVFCEIEVAE